MNFPYAITSINRSSWQFKGLELLWSPMVARGFGSTAASGAMGILPDLSGHGYTGIVCRTDSAGAPSPWAYSDRGAKVIKGYPGGSANGYNINGILCPGSTLGGSLRTLDITKSYTFCAWLKVGANMQSEYHGFMDFPTDVSNYVVNYVFSDNVYKLDFWFQANGNLYRVQATNTISPGNTYHIVYSYAGQRGVNLYLDGRLIVTGSTHTYTGTFNPISICSLASGNPAWTEAGDSELYEVRVYTRALSAGEVAELYNPATRWDLYKTVSPVTQSPVSYLWPFSDDFTGSDNAAWNSTKWITSKA